MDVPEDRSIDYSHKMGGLKTMQTIHDSSYRSSTLSTSNK